MKAINHCYLIPSLKAHKATAQNSLTAKHVIFCIFCFSMQTMKHSKSGVTMAAPSHHEDPRLLFRPTTFLPILEKNLPTKPTTTHYTGLHTSEKYFALQKHFSVSSLQPGQKKLSSLKSNKELFWLNMHMNHRDCSVDRFFKQMNLPRKKNLCIKKCSGSL